MRNVTALSALFISSLIFAACGGDSAQLNGPHGDRTVMWETVVFPRAASIPVDSTLALSVKALDYDKNEITEGVQITYKSQDESSVLVSDAGVLTALRPTFGSGIGIDINVQAGLLKKTITVYVGVTAQPVEIDSISLMPANGVTTLDMDGFAFLRARAYDPGGIVRDDVFALSELKNGNPDVSLIIVPTNGFALVRGTGKRWVYATTYVNGKLLQDSVEFTMLDRSSTTIQVRQSDSTGTIATFMAFVNHDNIHLQKNGEATFTNSYTTPVDIIFENPSAVTGGNIIALGVNQSVTRQFPTLGKQVFTVKGGTRTKISSITVTDNQ